MKFKVAMKVKLAKMQQAHNFVMIFRATDPEFPQIKHSVVSHYIFIVKIIQRVKVK
jgi:hypothetical protein